MSKRIQYLKQLANIIRSDGKIAPAEEKLFKDIAQSMGIEIESLEELEILEKISPPVSSSFSIEERISQIYGLALMIKVDGEIDPKEIESIRNIGIEMGLPVDSLNIMMETLFSKPGKILEFEELRQIFNLSNN